VGLYLGYIKKLKTLGFMSITNVMRKNNRIFNDEQKFILITVLVILMLLLTNFIQESIISIVARNALAVIFIFFLSGYTLVSILLEREKLESQEFLTHCIGLSICIAVVCAMVVNYVGMKVNFINIINLISITTVILAFLNFFNILGFKKIGGKK